MRAFATALVLRSERSAAAGSAKRTSLLPARSLAEPSASEPSDACSPPLSLEETIRRRTRPAAVRWISCGPNTWIRGASPGVEPSLLGADVTTGSGGGVAVASAERSTVSVPLIAKSCASSVVDGFGSDR